MVTNHCKKQGYYMEGMGTDAEWQATTIVFALLFHLLLHYHPIDCCVN
jgi:hypothetical protein